MDIPHRILEFEARYRAFKACGASRVTIAFSGGPDSSALLAGIVELKSALEIEKIRTVHVDHGLRPKTSSFDARHSRKIAKAFGADFRLVKVNTKARMKRARISMEMAARELRYAALEEQGYKSGLILLGHTRDDLAETAILRFLKGSGPAGIGSIPPIRDRYARPLINATRAEVMDYLRDKDMDFVEDETNLIPIAERNRVRLEIMPLIEERLNPGIKDTLAANADFYRAVDEHLSDEASKALNKAGKQPPFVIGLKEFTALPVAVRAYFIRGAVERLKGDVRNLRISNLMKAASFSCSGKVLKLTSDVQVRTISKKLEITRITAGKSKISS